VPSGEECDEEPLDCPVLSDDPAVYRPGDPLEESVPGRVGPGCHSGDRHGALGGRDSGEATHRGSGERLNLDTRQPEPQGAAPVRTAGLPPATEGAGRWAVASPRCRRLPLALPVRAVDGFVR